MKYLYNTSVLTLTFLIITSSLYGAIWRLNNNSNVDADFTNLEQVNDSSYVLPGDTILVEGSAINYGSADINKQLYIFGTGYYLNENPQTQANPSNAAVSSIDFEVGSEGSVFAGFEVTGSIDVFASDVVIKRNRISNYGVDVENNVSNVLIIQNYIEVYNSDVIYVADGSNNIFIQNNLLRDTYTSSSYYAIETYGTASAIVSNNVIAGNLDVSLSVLSNNIFMRGNYTGSNNQISNNIFGEEPIDTSKFPDPNLVNVDLTAVFDTTCATCHSTDGKLQIFDDGPAAGFGIDSVDCGMYGGVNPYVLSGIPEIPSIFYFYAPNTATAESGLPVKVKIKSNR